MVIQIRIAGWFDHASVWISEVGAATPGESSGMRSQPLDYSECDLGGEDGPEDLIAHLEARLRYINGYAGLLLDHVRS